MMRCDKRSGAWRRYRRFTGQTSGKALIAMTNTVSNFTSKPKVADLADYVDILERHGGVYVTVIHASGNMLMAVCQRRKFNRCLTITL